LLVSDILSADCLTAVDVSLGLITVEVSILAPSTLSTPVVTSRVPSRGPFLWRKFQNKTKMLRSVSFT
jgi:hypothetical protein